MENTINERVRFLIDYLKVSDKKFAEMIGVPQTTISNLFNRQTEPSYKILNAIANHIECISPDWLLTGKGDMITQNVTQNNQHGDNVNTTSGNVQITKNEDVDKKEIERLREENDRLKTELIEAKQSIIDLLMGKK